MHPTDGLNCCACHLQGGESFLAKSTEEMIDHILEHSRAGHNMGDIVALAQELRLDNDKNFPIESR